MGWFGDDDEEEKKAAVPMAAPINFNDDAAYQAELRKRLIDRMNAEERGMQADQVLGKEARASESELSRRLGLMDVFNRSAAQVGSIGGKIADTSAVTDNTERALDSQKQDVNWMDKDRSSREQLNKYLMGKLLDQEGKVSEGRMKQAELDQGAENNKYNRDVKKTELGQNQQKINLQKAELAQKGTEKKSGAQVPGSVAAELGQFDSALAMADDALKSYNDKAASAGSSLKSWLPGSDANQYEKERNVTAQAIGTILEGGKLTEQDYDRYKSMLPSPSDTNQIAQTKVAAIKNLIEQRRKGKIQGLQQTGFDVSGVSQREPEGFAKARAPGGQAIAAPAQQITPQDAQALRWAQEHQADPRAKAIFDRLKGKGM